MSDLQQNKFEIEVYGYTIVEDVLTESVAVEMRDVLTYLNQQHGTDHRLLHSQASSTSLLPAR